MHLPKVFCSEMIFLLLIFLSFHHSSTLSIGSANSVQNLTKRETTGEFYPDWVPFKTKHGDELGEFVAVTKKKPKKRLALPANFVLRAQSEQDSEDFFDKGQEDMGEDYYEKKEWSSLPKSEVDSDPSKISDINGIVNIITNAKENVRSKGEQTSSESEGHDRVETVRSLDPEDGNDGVAKDDSKEFNKDDSEYDEKAPAKESTQKVSEDQTESEANKAKILDSVDELKERHAKEQRAISEQVKEEEMVKEELEKDRYRDSREFDKYNNKMPVKWRRGNADYDEYEDKVFDVSNKYKIIGQKSQTRQPEKKTPKPPPDLQSTKPEKPIAFEKISVFTNPQAYVISDYEDSEETTTQKPMKPKTLRDQGSKKFSSRYVESIPKKDKSERISLEPQEDDFKEGEPTLFFPKKRTGKKRVKTKSSKRMETPETDSFESESVQEPQHKEPSYRTPKSVTHYVTLYDTEPTEKGNGASTRKKKVAEKKTTIREVKDTVPSAADFAINTAIITENDTPVTDALPSSSEQKEKSEPESFEYEKGRGEKHESSQEEEQEEHGKKAYEGKHEDTKTTKGHHDKEDHVGKYNDHGGVDKHHHDESGHYGHHHHEEHGKKHAKYEESGKHSKGHSTKGSHDIHKKEEYEKNVEFFEEDGDSIEEENHGGHHDEKGHGKGGHFKNGNLNAGHEGSSKATNGHHSKSGFEQFDKGHKSTQGLDQHGRHDQKNFHKEGKEAGNKWIYHHGHPAKTANLVVIDRRTDPYINGPRFHR